MFCISFAVGGVDVISGTVFDEMKNSLSNVNIYFPKEEIGTTSNENGNFIIDHSFQYPIIVIISHVGYESETIQINEGESKKLFVKLKKQFIQMDELVVTATRTKKLHKEVPISTEVINKSDINKSGASTVAELFSLRSGVSIQTSVDGGSVLNILGLDSRYILVLINGQPINGKFNNRVSLDQIYTQNIEQIEIVKGPSSSLYGSEAMAGVINIITNDKIVSKSHNVSFRSNNTETKLRNDGLSSGSKNLNLNIKQPFNFYDLSININADEISNDKSIELIEIDKIKKRYIETIFGIRGFKKHKLFLTFNAFKQSDSGQSKLMVTDTKIERGNLFLTHHTGSFSQTITGSSYRRNYVQNRPWGELVRDDLTSEEYFEYEALFKKKIGRYDFNSGLEFRKAIYSSDRIRDGRQNILNNSFFAQSSFSFNEALSFILGLRNDNYSEYQSVINPRIGAMYIIDKNWKFRTSWGKGFRAPSFMERYIDWNHVQFNYTVIGNKNLKPEISNGTTVGVEYTNPKRYQSSIMLYYNKFDNLINDYVLEPGKLSYQNIESATFAGLEILHNWKISEFLSSKLSLSFLRNRDSENNSIPNTIPLTASGVFSFDPDKDYSASINIKWIAPYKPQDFDPINGIFVSADKEIDGYTILNFTGSKSFNNFLYFKFGLNNVTNYTNNRFGPFVGRSAFIELSSKIN